MVKRSALEFIAKVLYPEYIDIYRVFAYDNFYDSIADLQVFIYKIKEMKLHQKLSVDF